MIEKVDHLIQQLEILMTGRQSQNRTDFLEEAENTAAQALLRTPIRELSPDSKMLLYHLLEEAVDTMDAVGLKDHEIDDSQSSIELVLSIVREAGKRFGLSEDDWPQKILTEQSAGNKNNDDDDTINSEVEMTAGGEQACK